jgi:NifU-like N terminal domain
VNVDPADASTDRLAPEVRRLFADLAHAGTADAEHEERWAHGEAGREDRGTRVHFALRLHHGRPVQVRYRAYGCPHTLAVCEWLAREAEAGRLASIGSPEDWCRQLGVPNVKLGRLLVVEDALRAALGTENVVK